MKRFSEQFKKKSDSIRLRVSERNVLRDRLTSYMEYHPLSADMKAQKVAPARTQVGGIICEPFKAISINMTYVRSFAGVFAIFMVVGIPIIAEKAVPGDMLYSVKTNITEELRASLTISPYAKVEWETQRLERRVSEARLLASEGKLTPETEATVAQAVKEHTDAANQEIALMRETDEDGAAMAEIAFASAMSVQSEVLDGHIKKDPDTKDSERKGHSVVILAGVVNGVRDQADVAQAGASPSYEGLIGKVETQTTRAYELFNSVQKNAATQEITNIERRLADIERKLIEAMLLHTTSESIVSDEMVGPETVASGVLYTDAEQQSIVEETAIDINSVARTEEFVVDEVVDQNKEGKEIIKEVVISKEEQTQKAIALLRLALTDVQKLIIFMTDIDVRKNVTIEELVPITATLEERTQAVKKQLDVVLRMQTDIALHILSEDLSEKVSLGTVVLEKEVTSVAKMLEEGNIDGAEQHIEVAYDVAEDVQKLVADLPRMESDVAAVEEVKVEGMPSEINAQIVPNKASSTEVSE